MKHSTPSASKHDLARFETLKQIGCIVCRVYLGAFREIDVSHLLSGNKRRGHQQTVGECPWHHRAVPMFGLSQGQTRELLGPSRADGSKPYRARFGTDDELLSMQDALIAAKRAGLN